MAGVYCTDTPEHVQNIVQKYHLGGIMFDAKIGKAPAAHIAQLIQAARTINPQIIIGFDAEWGIAQRCNDTEKYPYARELGTINNLEHTYAIAHAIGIEAKKLAIDLVFAPVLDIDTNPENPVIGKRSFGNTPALVIAHGDQYIRGLEAAGVVSCVKHFPGHGDTHIDSHIGLPTITHTRERLEQIELAPFKHATDNSIPALMIAHIVVPALDPEYPTSLSHTTITKLLRKTWNYTGVIITDALNMGALINNYTPQEIVLNACLAGADILLYPADLDCAYHTILTAVRTGIITREVLAQKIARIKPLRRTH